MVITSKVVVGSVVSVVLKSNPNVKVRGLVKRIIRSDTSGVLVELVDGHVGIVSALAPRRPSSSAIKSARSDLVKVRRPEVSSPTKDSASDRVIEELFSGENSKVEYKTSVLWSQDLSKKELDERNTFEIRQYGNRASKVILAKTIAALLNADGGTVVIGIMESKDQGKSHVVVGIDDELKKLRNKDFGVDGYRRMIIDEVIKPYFPNTIFHHVNNYINIFFLQREGRLLCLIKVSPSDHHVFLSVDNKDLFFIKVDAETRELLGKSIVDYIKRKWS